MTVTMVVGVFGAISGGISLLLLMIGIGVYKERIDRHERVLNLLVEDSVMQAWRSGAVDKGSLKTADWVREALPADTLRTCQNVARKFGAKGSFHAIAGELVKQLNGQLTDLSMLSESWQHEGKVCALSGRFGLSPMEILGTLVTYTQELGRGERYAR